MTNVVKYVYMSSVKGASHILIMTFYGRLERIVDDIMFISGFA